MSRRGSVGLARFGRIAAASSRRGSCEVEGGASVKEGLFKVCEADVMVTEVHRSI